MYSTALGSVGGTGTNPVRFPPPPPPNFRRSKTTNLGPSMENELKQSEPWIRPPIADLNTIAKPLRRRTYYTKDKGKKFLQFYWSLSPGPFSRPRFQNAAHVRRCRIVIGCSAFGDSKIRLGSLLVPGIIISAGSASRRPRS